MQYLLAGLGLGLGAGLAPGPLQALVISVALSRGFASGARVAASPLLSDVVVIAASLLLLRSIPDGVVVALGVVGGLVVVWLGIEAVREVGAEVEAAPRRTGDSLLRGVLVNLLSPHPWIFWLTVGGPVLLAARAESVASALAFLTGFYLLLVGSKVALAAVVAGGRRRLSPAALRRAHLAAGALLILTGVLLAAEFARTLLP